VVLVLNGGHSSHCDSPVPFMSLLIDQGFRVLIPSRPGYGKAPSSTGRKAESFADTLQIQHWDELTNCFTIGRKVSRTCWKISAAIEYLSHLQSGQDF
jgi:hypothetical protein